MPPDEIRAKLKDLMIRELQLVGKNPSEIDDSAPLFGGGLSLDSLDALQLAMVVEEQFGVRVPEGDAARAIFASVDALVRYIELELLSDSPGEPGELLSASPGEPGELLAGSPGKPGSP